MGAAGMGATGMGAAGMGAAAMGHQEWVRQEACQKSQADPARTHPDQGTVGWPEQVFPVSAVPLRQQPMVPLAGNRSSRLRVRSCPPENGLTPYTCMPG